jgi:hypothetical protein
MEMNQNPQNQIQLNQQILTQEQMMVAIYEHTRKTMNYMKWQLYITLILVVLPLLAMVVILPMVMSSLGTLGGIYGPGGVLSQ